jgi:acyl-coenzyme A synthetase/AMP-(fatty) acid ligase
MDFAKLIAFQASIGPGRPALAYTGGIATYGVLAGAVSVALDRLRALGLKPGQLAAIDVRNPFHHTALLIALALEGVASISVQNAFAIQSSGLQIDVLLADRYARPAPGITTAAVDDSWFDHDPKRTRYVAKLMRAPGMLRQDRVIRVVSSSGVTGRPKSVAITTGVLGRRLANGAFTHGGGSFGGARVMSLMGLSTLPAFMSVFGTLCGGGVICFAPNPAEALQVIQMLQVELLSLTPFQLQILLEAEGTSPPPPSLRSVILGGARTPRGQLAMARARLCANVMVGYGTTEAGSIAHAPAAAVESNDHAAGYILPWAELQVVDEADEPVGPGVEGRFRVRSNEMAGYAHGSVAEVKEVGDWFYPGDVGAIDAEGMVFVTGRLIEVINRGGSIVAPDFVDEVLNASGLVSDCAAFGVMNEKGIEEIWAAVVPAPGYEEQQLLHHCREKLADRAPERLVQVAEIPRSDVGKVLRSRVRESVLAAAE